MRHLRTMTLILCRDNDLSSKDWETILKRSRGGCRLLWSLVLHAKDPFLFHCLESQEMLSGTVSHVDLSNKIISDTEYGILSVLLPLNAPHLLSINMG
jgi:hypothetical protein